MPSRREREDAREKPRPRLKELGMKQARPPTCTLATSLCHGRALSTGHAHKGAADAHGMPAPGALVARGHGQHAVLVLGALDVAMPFVDAKAIRAERRRAEICDATGPQPPARARGDAKHHASRMRPGTGDRPTRRRIRDASWQLLRLKR